jgi:sarcosine oxidase subunit beta
MARILIAGSGAIGVCIAHSLAERGARGVVLCDRGEIAGGATGKAMGGVRQQFSTAIEVELTRRSVGFFEKLGSPYFEQVGYLFVASTEKEWEALRARAEHQRSLGVPVETADRARIAALAPGVAAGDLLGGVFCGKDGLADPPATALEVARRARSLGVEILEHADARTIQADVRILAAGAYSAELGREWGVELPIRPLIRQLFETGPILGIAPRLPMVIESETGFHFRRRGDGLRVAMGDPAPRWSFDARVDESVLGDRLRRLAHRFPAAAGARVDRAWAGLYDMTPDAHPILGKVGDSLFVACGFSGHGFMQAPAVGEAIAQLVLEGGSDLDLAPFSLGRFKDGASFAETVVL